MKKGSVYPSKILWVDLEMTGLDPKKDVILEVAAEITDFNFRTLASYEARVKQDASVVVARMRQNTWWQDYPENRDDFVHNLEKGKTSQQVEAELVALVTHHFGSELAILGGNSIHNDRKFIEAQWPALDLKLHYRMLDVSSMKVWMQGRHGLEYQKPDLHRAFEDIQASIAEWQYYLEKLKDL